MLFPGAARAGAPWAPERFPALGRLGRLGREVPFVPQLNAMECGAACLAMVLGYHGKEVSLEQVRDNCPGGRDGVQARDLLDVGGRFGLAGRGGEGRPRPARPAARRLDHPALAVRALRGAGHGRPAGGGDRRPGRRPAAHPQGRAEPGLHRRGADLQPHRPVHPREAPGPAGDRRCGSSCARPACCAGSCCCPWCCSSSGWPCPS